MGRPAAARRVVDLLIGTRRTRSRIKKRSRQSSSAHQSKPRDRGHGQPSKQALAKERSPGSEALGAIARKAIDRKTGARGLRSIMEIILLDTMFGPRRGRGGGDLERGGRGHRGAALYLCRPRSPDPDATASQDGLWPWVIRGDVFEHVAMNDAVVTSRLYRTSN